MEMITQMNMHIFLFTDSINRYRMEHNKSDNNMIELLGTLLQTIDEFVDHTKIVPATTTTEININTDYVQSQDLLYCQICNIQLGKSYQNYLQHISSRPHIRRLKKNDEILIDSSSSAMASSESLVTVSDILNAMSKECTPKSLSPIPSTSQIDLLTAPADPLTKKSKLRDLPNVKVKRDVKKATDVIKVLAKAEQKQKYKDIGKLSMNVRNFLQSRVEFMVMDFLENAKILANESNYSELVDNLKLNLQKDFENLQVTCFGSRLSGLSFDNGDLDVNLFVGGPTSKLPENMKTITELLNADKKNWRLIVPIFGARTPIIKAINITHNIHCDFTFNNILGPSNTALMMYLFELQPDCYKVAGFIKLWARKSLLDKRINGYTFILLVVFYFQKKRLLPPIAELMEGVQQPPGIWNSNFERKTLAELNLKTSNNFMEHVLGFLIFYGSSYQFTQQVICPAAGVSLSAQLFLNKNIEFPPSLERLQQYLQKTPENDSIKLVSKRMVMCVQDPFELIHNVAKSINATTLKLFRRICCSSSELLRS